MSDNPEEQYRKIVGLVAVVVNFIGVYILTAFPFGSYRLRLDDLLAPLPPAVIAALAAWYISGKIAQWYQKQL